MNPQFSPVLLVAPEGYLTPTEYMGKQGFLLKRHQRGELFINTARVQKEYDSTLKQYFYLIDISPNQIDLPQTRRTPKNERKHLLREFGELKPAVMVLDEFTNDQAIKLQNRLTIGPFAEPMWILYCPLNEMRFGQEYKTNQVPYPIYLHNTSKKGNVRIHVDQIRKVSIDNEDYYLILVEEIKSEIKQQQPTSLKKPNQQYHNDKFP